MSLIAAGAAAAFSVSCSGDDRLMGGPLESTGDGVPPPPNCDMHQVGCPCLDGQTIDCGKVERVSGDYVSCSQGKQTCDNGVWGECIGDKKAQTWVPNQKPGFGEQNLGGATPCAQNPCDPQCIDFNDVPGGLDAGGFLDNDGGLELAPSGAGGGGVPPGCTGIAVAPPTANMAITSANPFVTNPANITFTASWLPAGCSVSPVNPVWLVDRFDVSTINMSGVFTLISTYAGPIQVMARVGATVSAPSIVTVAGSIYDVSGTVPGLQTKFNGVPPVTGIPDLTCKILYPQDQTLFPLGLPAPVFQWYDTNPANGMGNGIKITLRFPANGSLFSYQKLIGGEPNPQNFTFPADVWRAFENAAKGSTGQIAIQRSPNGVPSAMNETVVNVSFATAKMRGTVYYNSYNSNLNNGQGAVLALKLGNTAPTLAIAGSYGQCHVCHSVSADGTTLYEGGQPGSFNLTNGGTLIRANSDKRFDWGGFYPDGSMMLTSVSTFGPQGGANVPSNLYKVNSPFTVISTTGFTNIVKIAGTPIFSPDGRKVAFNFAADQASWMGTPQANNSFHDLAAMDFNCGAAPGSVTCSGAMPYAFTGLRQLYHDATGLLYPVWPSFLPDANGLLFGNSFTNTFKTKSGNGQVWFTDVPNAGGPAAQPYPLWNLNGYAANHITSALPYIPLYFHGSHAGGDLMFNYEPTVSPQMVGGYYWAIFTTRRAYGNIAHGDPFDAGNGNYPICNKLWMAAIDPGWVPGAANDPSHPAFLIPGQELNSDALRGFFAKSACAPPGVSAASLCDDDTDCCGGTATPQTAICALDLPIPAPPAAPTRHCKSLAGCVALMGACTQDAQCCGNGVACISGSCTTVVGPPQPATFTRDYGPVVCPDPNDKVVWHFFDYEGLFPSDSSIVFDVQTADTVANLAAAPVTVLGTAKGPPVDQTGSFQGWDVAAAIGPNGSRDILRVNMHFYPSTMAPIQSPVLTDWRQSYDCVPNQ